MGNIIENLILKFKNTAIVFLAILLLTLLSSSTVIIFAESLNLEKDITWSDKQYDKYYLLGETILAAPNYNDGEKLKLEFMDKNFKTITISNNIDSKFSALKIAEAFINSEELAPVYIDGKYGYIDKYGNEVIKSRYDEAGSFSNDLAKVKVDGKYGYIDKSGNYIIEAKYDDISYFSDDKMLVKISGKYGLISKN